MLKIFTVNKFPNEFSSRLNHEYEFGGNGNETFRMSSVYDFQIDKVEANFDYDNKMKYLKEICSEMKSQLSTPEKRVIFSGKRSI